MTHISKYKAFIMAFSFETAEQMVEIADTDNIDEMREQALIMAHSSLALRSMAGLTILLLFVANCCKKPEGVGEYVFTTLCAATTGLSVHTLQRLYNTACYLRIALGRCPGLRARLLNTL